MRDYQIEGLPHQPFLRIEPISPDRLPRIAEKGLELMQAKGYDRKDPEHVKHHLFDDGTKPPRVVALLVASQAVKELSLAGLPPTRKPEHIYNWLLGLPDEAILPLFRECIIRTN